MPKALFFHFPLPPYVKQYIILHYRKTIKCKILTRNNRAGNPEVTHSSRNRANLQSMRDEGMEMWGVIGQSAIHFLSDKELTFPVLKNSSRDNRVSSSTVSIFTSLSPHHSPGGNQT